MLNNSEADSAALRMQSTLPLDVLADELGAAAGRIERELRLKDEARAARFEARLAAIEIAAFKAEEERQRKFEARLAELRDGKDGEPGSNGKDADIEPLIKHVQTIETLSAQHIGLLSKELTDKVNAKIAEVKNGEPGKDADIESFRREFIDDMNGLETQLREFFEATEVALVNKVDAKLAEIKDGKDGEPGKDADIEPLVERVQLAETLSVQHIELLSKELTDKVDSRLAEVKDGKDGEPGKDADISGVTAQFKKHEAFVLDSVERLQFQIQERLAEVKNGIDGEPGPQGPSGKDGKDGKLPIVREWTSRVHYAGDVVRHGGATYQALTDTGQQPPHSDWGELASRGTDGIGFVLRGTYDAAAEYRQHDIVMINRNSFAAKYDAPGECPGDGWQLFAPSGGRGKEGPPGPKGADGKSIAIANLKADPDAMVLLITDSLGKTFSLDLEPIAERIIEATR